MATRNRLVGLILLALAFAFLLQGKISVVSAERTARFESFGFTATESSEKTVLVLTLKGTEEDHYEKLGGRDFWLTAGESRYDLIGITGGLDANGRVGDNYRLVFAVPKATTSFVLHWEKQTVQFSVTGPIKKIIK